MTKERTYTWFFEPLNEQANSAIANLVGGQNAEQNILLGVICEDGKPHDFWQCTLQNTLYLWPQRSSGMRFEVWCQEGNGAIKKKTGIVRSMILEKATLRKNAAKVPA